MTRRWVRGLLSTLSTFPAWREISHRVVVVIVVGGVLTASCASDESGCGSGPQSAPLEEGKRTAVDLRHSEGHWQTPDAGGAWWSTSDLPPPPGGDGVVRGEASIVEATYSATGGLRSGVLRVEVAGLGAFDLEGPLFCE